MDSNYAPIIKEEILNENESVATVLSDSDINNILVKNEPILDEDTSFVTITNEALIDAPFASTVCIKNENQLETQLASVDRFVIYELETPHNGKQTNNVDQLERPTYKFSNNTNVPLINNTNLTLTLNNIKSSDKHNSETVPFPQVIDALSDRAGSASNTTTSIPILLNTKLRKRNKIILTGSSLDKRTRYNIEGTLTKTPRSSEVSNVIPTTQTNSKKIINHLMKHKHVQRKQEKRMNEEKRKDFTKIIAELPQFASSNSVEPTPDSSLPSIENNVKTMLTINCQSPTMMIASQDNIVTKPELTPSSKRSTAAAITGELRVKCLCRLTIDSSKTTENSEIVDFFKEMYEKTRVLTKKQQREVKITLLQSISEAENAVEQGKCCCF